MLKKFRVLIKKGDVVSQQDYDKYAQPSDTLYYYVYYSSRHNLEGDFLVYTNQKIFEEARIVYKSKRKEEAIQVAETINKSMRLLAGYYDDDISYKNMWFPKLS